MLCWEAVMFLFFSDLLAKSYRQWLPSSDEVRNFGCSWRLNFKSQIKSLKSVGFRCIKRLKLTRLNSNIKCLLVRGSTRVRWCQNRVFSALRMRVLHVQPIVFKINTALRHCYCGSLNSQLLTDISPSFELLQPQKNENHNAKMSIQKDVSSDESLQGNGFKTSSLNRIKPM